MVRPVVSVGSLNIAVAQKEGEIVNVFSLTVQSGLVVDIPSNPIIWTPSKQGS